MLVRERALDGRHRHDRTRDRWKPAVFSVVNAVLIRDLAARERGGPP
jgi:hypothetical protein